MCTSFRNRYKSEPWRSFLPCFAFSVFSHIYCVYPAMSESQKELPNCGLLCVTIRVHVDVKHCSMNTLSLICFPKKELFIAY